MNYFHIVTAFAGELWALDRVKLDQIVSFLIFKAEGGAFSPEEMQARVGLRREREAAASSGSVAVIGIHGIIAPRVSRLGASETGTPLDAVAAQFRSVLADDSVKAIVFDVDSPGGMTDGVEEFAQEIYEARGTKPIVSQINSLAASAAYWLATQADEVIATPSGSAGSIGVYTVHENISKALEMKGIQRTMISAGKHKTEGNPYAPLGEEAREHFQERVSAANSMFVKTVARGRGVSVADVNAHYGQGRTYGAAELKKRGMVDRVAPMKDTLARFGVNLSPAKRTQASAARATLALGRIPAIGDFEAFLREAGTPKDLATALASGGLAKVKPGDPVLKDRSESDPLAKGAVSKDDIAAIMRAIG